MLFSRSNLEVISNVKFLRNFLLLAILAAVSFPLYEGFWVYPRFVEKIVREAENLSIQTAYHLGGILKSVDGGLSRDNLPREFLDEMNEHIHDFHLEKVKVFDPKGEVVFSTTPKDIGTINKRDYYHNVVAKGLVYTKVVEKDSTTMEGRKVVRDVVETYVPIMRDGEFFGAHELVAEWSGIVGIRARDG